MALCVWIAILEIASRLKEKYRQEYYQTNVKPTGSLQPSPNKEAAVRVGKERNIISAVPKRKYHIVGQGHANEDLPSNAARLWTQSHKSIKECRGEQRTRPSTG